MTMHSDLDVVTDIESRPISDHEWRIIDRLREETEGLGYLGVVRRIGDVWEASSPGSPFARAYFGSKESAIEFLGLPR